MHGSYEYENQFQRVSWIAAIALIIAAAMALSLYTTTPKGEVQYLSLKSRLGLISTGETYRLAQVCQHLEMNDCAVTAYVKAATESNEFTDGLIEVARIYKSSGKSDAAVTVYLEYIENPDADIDRMVEIAEALNAAGRMNEAIAMYRSSVEDVDGLINISAAKGLIRLYISNGNKRLAQQAIREFNRKTKSADEFLAKEIQALRRM